jgi:ubiquinone/menaquinone biosynthesis C-methylase UbiE
VDVVHADALCVPLPNESADRIVSSFGLKTFSPSQIVMLGREMARLLKPGGAFSFVEIALPRFPLRLPFRFYLTYIIPVIGRLFLGNPDNYRLLSVYAQHFSEGPDVAEVFARHGFSVRSEKLFFGCARRITGTKR